MDVRIAELLHDAGTDTGLVDRHQALAAEIGISELAIAQAKLELALAFHHAIRDDQEGIRTSIRRLRELTRRDYYAYYADIAHFMAGLPLPAESASPARWLNGEQNTRARWSPRGACTFIPRSRPTRHLGLTCNSDRKLQQLRTVPRWPSRRDGRAAQQELHQVRAEYEALCRTLP
ncbi:hypothetical protein [Streptomyces sp. Ru73]|uniref:hypothetical protein n=1 Tax=Streptomyces sp. Ru73 TaxID=2080748 RepID=UPI002156115D|nr:hypothetical protein [Streptomyces sp. Ru73]